MNNEQFELLAGMLADIAYEMFDADGISEKLSEMLLELWRNFSHYSENRD